MSVRGRLLTGTWLALVALLASGCGNDAPAASPPPSSPPSPPAAQTTSAPDLPDGWRWESFAGVEVGVPGSWGWTVGNQRIGQWCVGSRDRREPAVGRPGESTMAGCLPAGGTRIRHTGLVVALSPAYDGAPEPGVRGDQEVRRVGDVLVTVNAPPDLRAEILATAREATVDHHGCAMATPPGLTSPPVTGRDVTTLGDVTAVTACRYPLGDVLGGGLQSSVRLEGTAASDVVSAIAAAPIGGGPDDPDSCLARASYGDEMLLVHVESASGTSEVHAYFSGCDHNGFDDGTAVRRLSAASIGPLLGGPNAPSGMSGPQEKIAMIRG